MKRIHCRVSGRVQGVYFRASTQETARGLGLAGWVRNLPDGRVELVAEGAPEAVDRLVTWLQEGPPAARVERVDVEVEVPAGAGGDFEVRR
jgi:acylphosphatase